VASLREELKKLGTSGLVYLVPNVLLRGLSFLLTPIYARALTPADYGAVGVATTIGGIVSVLLGLSLHGSVTRLHFECKDDRERRTFYGTLLTFELVVPTVLAVLLHVLGSAGVLDVFATVRFDPHLRIVLWTAWAQMFLYLPTSMYMVREQPARVMLLNGLAAATQIGLTLLYVRKTSSAGMRSAICSRSP
jgi:O-antigen/teichoic acid export membrane protein